MNLRDESGQAVVMGALCMALLLGFVSLGVEIGMLFAQQQALQTAADSAAITGAQEINYGDVESAAKADAAQNGYTDGVNNVTVTVSTPPADGPNATAAGFVEVIVSKQQRTWFMGLAGKSSMTVTARSVATLAPAQNCMYALNSTGTDVNISNGADIDLTGCNIYGASSGSTDFSASGGAKVTASNILMVGGSSVSGGAKVLPTPTTGVTAVSDPLAYLSPPSFSASSCVANPNIGYGTHSIGPSSGGTICYNGLSVGGGGTLTLDPGLYIINGTLSFGGGASISGTGVTFYLPPGAALSIGNGADEVLAAPTSGTYNGILFYQDRSNTTTEDLEGGTNSSFQGILYFPKANFTFENGTSTTTYASIIAGSLTFKGGTKLQNYAQKNRQSPLNSARLVE